MEVAATSRHFHPPFGVRMIIIIMLSFSIFYFLEVPNAIAVSKFVSRLETALGRVAGRTVFQSGDR